VITTGETFEATTFPRLVAAYAGANVAPGTRIVAGSLVAEGEPQAVQVAGRMRYPTPRTVSTNRT
jgi:hypothetical protein